MIKLRLVLLATTAITAMPIASSVSHAQTAPIVMAQAAPPASEVGPDGKPKPKEGAKGPPPGAAPPPAAPPPPAAAPRPAPPPPPPAAAPPPRPAPPPPP